MVASNPLDESSKKLNRRRVSATVGAIVLTLGACIAMPVAMLCAAEDEPSAAAATEVKPKHEDCADAFQSMAGEFADGRKDSRVRRLGSSARR